ncbi:MAG: PAS domain S-box protein [Gammaproteobacteria bacterium]|nr:PAS domain S-box protein [Gammaproteobacteria bacterium]
MSFRLKIILGLVVIQLLLLVILVWSSLNFLRGSNEIELSNRATSISEILASTLEDKLLSGDREGLLTHIHEILALPGTVYVRIVNPAGDLVAEGGNATGLVRPFAEDFLFDDVDDGIYDVSADIVRGGENMGSVQLGLSVQSINGIMDAARREMATIAMFGFAVSVIFSVFLGNYFRRRLTNLRDATRRIASGDIGYQVPVLGGDELAQTAGAFNTMSRKLVSLYSEKQAALTGARQKAQELQQSERRIHAVLHHAMDAIITIDENGQIESFNPAATRIFGYSAGEAIGQGLGILLPEPYLAEHERHIQQFIRGGDRAILGAAREIQGLRMDNTQFPLEIDISEMEIEGHYLFIVIARDITERKRLEERIRSTMESAPISMLMVDSDGSIVLVNAETENLFGYSRNELLGKSIEILVPERFRSRHPSQRQGYFAAPEARRMGKGRDLFGLCKNGSEFPVEIGLNPVVTKEGLLVLATVLDITERKQAESELRQAKEFALESSRSKFEFIANVSQEVRVPVNSMLSTLNLLLGTELAPEQRERVAAIRASGESLITIINDVLDFSKIEAGKLYLESIDFDLWQTVDIVYQLYRDQAARKGVNLVYVMPYSTPTGLRGDPTRLRQLLTNLVDNAVKFTEKGEVVLRIEVLEDAEQETVLRFAVSDTGPGIAAATQKRIFEIFTRAEAPLTPRYGSSGLGLVISKRLTEMMDGAIGVESEPGRGSLFWFTCRFMKQPDAKPAPRPVSHELGHLRALIVNSDAVALASMQNMVSELGLNSAGVDDGVRALHELITAAERRQPYDVVIFDMMMRGMSGLRFARTVREDGRISRLYMIMVATTGYRGDSEEVRHAGVQGYLTAPFDREQLLECIAAVTGIDRNDHETFVTRHSLAASRLPQHGHALVLAVEDDRQKQLLARLERIGYRASLALDAREALDAAVRGHYDLILVDNGARELLDAESIRRLRGREHQGTHIPVMVIVSPSASNAQCQSYRAAGADECFTSLVEVEELNRKRLLG